MSTDASRRTAQRSVAKRREALRSRGLKQIEVWLNEDLIKQIDLFTSQHEARNRVDGLLTWTESMENHGLGHAVVKDIMRRFELPTVYHAVVIALDLLHREVEKGNVDLASAEGLPCFKLHADGRVRTQASGDEGEAFMVKPRDNKV